jgi:hypothetical protein
MCVGGQDIPVIEEQEQQMEILEQPKQFAGGGIVNALMATPIGQAAIREYAEGGEIKFGDYKHDYDLTHDPLEDILKGLIYGKGTPEERRASFFHSGTPGKVVDWGPEEEVEEKETPKLKRIRKILKPKQEEHHGDSYDPDRDKSKLDQPTLLGPLGRGLVGLLPGGAFLGALADRHAVGKAMGTSPYARSLQPSFFDHLTMGMFDTSGLYDKMVENMSYGNPYGRHGETSVEEAKQQAILHDYTHRYGDEDQTTLSDQQQEDFDHLQSALEAEKDSGRDWSEDEAGEEGPTDDDPAGAAAGMGGPDNSDTGWF